MTPSLFGRQNVVRNAEYVLVVGGATGTADEVDLAVTMGIPVIPYPASGGTARRFYESATEDRRLRDAVPAQIFAGLADCASAEVYVALVRQELTDGGTESR